MINTTHTVTQVEELMFDYFNRLKQAETVEEKRAILKKLRPLEKHWRDVNSKYHNGHKYPERMKGFPDDIPMNKEAVLKLIDSVPDANFNYHRIALDTPNLEGVSVGKNTFEYVDKGWPKAKEPKQGKLM